MLLCLSLLLTGCGTTRLVPKPYPVPGPERIKHVPVPAYLLTEIKPIVIPEDVTYGELIMSCGKDRDNLEILNGQLRAIRALSEGS